MMHIIDAILQAPACAFIFLMPSPKVTPGSTSPTVLKNKIKNRFILSFLHYIPYTVLSVMTIPAIFYSTSSVLSALVGFLAAIVTAYFGKSLLKVAATSCSVVFVVEFIMKLL